jgi:hypothetical protein
VILGRAASVGVCSLAVMSASQMRVEDRLAGASNWSSWKARMVFVLEDLELWDIVQAVVPAIPLTAPILGAEYKKKNNKAKRTISDGVRDHIIPRSFISLGQGLSLGKVFHFIRQGLSLGQGLSFQILRQVSSYIQ